MFLGHRSIKNGLKIKSKRALMLSTTALVASGLLALPVQAEPANSWDYDVVLGGSVLKDTSLAGTTNLTVNSGNGFVEGNADIYSGHTVNVTGDSGATFAYRDNRSSISTTIDGNLNSNMKIVIIDNNGVFYNSGAKVDVQSLVTTSANVQVNDVMNGGDLTFKNVKFGGDLINDGQITVAEAGLAAFVAPTIKNSGTISATLGNVVMASGKKVTLDLYGDGLVEVAVSGKLSDALIENTGRILAEGGNVQITAKAAKATIDNIVNNEGIISASSATVQGGKIILSGGKHGTVRNDGLIEAVGGAGGSVKVKAERFQNGGTSTPSSTPYHGLPKVLTGGGDVKITTSGDIEIKEGFIDADGGDITLKNRGSLYSRANTLKTSGTGTIRLNQNQSSADDAKIQVAIDAVSNTGTGRNTINVGAGTYAESVRVDHANVSLKGANSHNGHLPYFKHGIFHHGRKTVITPTYAGVYITADNAVIDGFEIKGGMSGVRVNNADHALIRNNYIHDQFHPSAEGDSFAGFATGDGVFLQNSANSVVSNNYIKHANDDGIHAVDVHNLKVKRNVIFDGGNGDEGIAISHATGKTSVTHNIILSARRDGIQLADVDGRSIVSNNFIYKAGRSGVNFVNVTGKSVIDNNYILRTGSYGIDIQNSDHVVIGKGRKGNWIHKADIGINLNNSSHIKLGHNRITAVNTKVVITP